jgi:hypothetical protein
LDVEPELAFRSDQKPKEKNMKKLQLVILAALLAGSAQAQIIDNWWGLDSYTTLTYTTTSVDVPTGYWNGDSPFFWGGYNWAANQGWWYPLTDPNVSPYVSRYGLGWDPSGYTLPFFGFTDWYDYQYTSLTAQTVYTWSWYDIHPNYSYVWDIYTGVNGSQVIPFNSVFQSSVIWSYHYWAYDGGLYTGLFTPCADVIASQSAITAYLTAHNISAADITALEQSQVVEDAIAYNNNGLGTDSIFIQYAYWQVPEPSTVSLLALGALALLRRRQGKV